MSTDTLEFPPIAEPEPVKPASQRAALALLDLKDVTLARFGDWRTGAKALVDKYKGVQFADLDTTKGYKALTEAIAEVRAPRFTAQNVDKAFASEVTKLRTAVGSEKDQIVAFLDATEKALVAQKDAHDKKVAAEKVEAERIAAEKREAERIAEEERVRKHTNGIALMRSYLGKAAGLPSERIAKGIAALEAIQLVAADWDEFFADANAAKDETLASLRALHEKTLAAEMKAAEDARIAEANRVEAERLAAERAQFEHERAAFLAAQEAAKPQPTEYTEARDAQQVLKAEAATPDATDRAAPVNASPSVGSMGVCQPADAGAPEVDPVAALVLHIGIARHGRFPNAPKVGPDWWVRLYELTEAVAA